MSPDIMAQASEWLARRDAGFAPSEQADFDTWLAADPRHAVAATELGHAWTMLNRPRDLGRANHVLLELATRRERRGRRARGVAWAGLAAAAVLAMAVVPFGERSEAPDSETFPSTVTLRPMLQTLADGSLVQLNVGAEISVEFSAAQRAIKLVRGEAHFAVVKDPARPFVVSAGTLEVRAVGTEFAVRLAPEQVDVLVTEGKVAAASSVAPAASEPGVAQMLVPAGRRVVIPLADASVSGSRSEQVSPAQIDAALAWRGKHVEFTGTPLADAVTLFNRQNTLQLSFADPAHGKLRVSGVFWLDDPEGFARLLEASFSVKAVRVGPGAIAIQ